MRWSSIKSMILLLLIIVNVALLALVETHSWKNRQNARETETRMIDVLAGNGVDYLPEELPPDMEGGDTITAATALARFLEALRREGYVCSQITDMYAARDGETPVWRISTDAWPWLFTVNGYSGEVTVSE